MLAQAEATAENATGSRGGGLRLRKLVLGGVIAIAVIILLVVGMFIQVATTNTPAPVSSGPVTVSPSAWDVPQLYQQAAVVASNLSSCHISPDVLLGVAWNEHNYVLGDASTSFTGAEGPMQFEPATWATYARLVAALSVQGGTQPPDVQNVPDALTAAAIMLCSDGASAGPWSAGDQRAVGIYNCGGTWVADPGACVTVDGGRVVDTTAAYVARVAAVANGLAKRGIPTASASQSTSPNVGSSTSGTEPSTTWVSGGTPAQQELYYAIQFLGQNAGTPAVQVSRDLALGICQAAGLPDTLGPLTRPALGDVAVWGTMTGIVVGGIRSQDYLVETVNPSGTVVDVTVPHPALHSC